MEEKSRDRTAEATSEDCSLRLQLLEVMANPEMTPSQQTCQSIHYEHNAQVQCLL